MARQRGVRETTGRQRGAEDQSQDFVQIPKKLFEVFRSDVIEELAYYSLALNISPEFLLKNPHFVETIVNNMPDLPNIPYTRTIKRRKATQIRVALCHT